MTTPSSGLDSDWIEPITRGTDPARPRASSDHRRARTASLFSSDSVGASIDADFDRPDESDAAAVNVRRYLDATRHLHCAYPMRIAVPAIGEAIGSRLVPVVAIVLGTGANNKISKIS